MGMSDEYIPYGPEWEVQMKQAPKSILIEMIRVLGKERDALAQKVEDLHYEAMGEDL
jgi:hypothetical protein